MHLLWGICFFFGCGVSPENLSRKFCAQDVSGTKGMLHLPGGWSWERFKVVQVGWGPWAPWAHGSWGVGWWSGGRLYFEAFSSTLLGFLVWGDPFFLGFFICWNIQHEGNCLGRFRKFCSNLFGPPPHFKGSETGHLGRRSTGSWRSHRHTSFLASIIITIIILITTTMFQISTSLKTNKCIPTWWFQIFFKFQPYLGKIPILTSIFFKGVGEKPPKRYIQNFSRHTNIPKLTIMDTPKNKIPSLKNHPVSSRCPPL